MYMKIFSLSKTIIVALATPGAFSRTCEPHIPDNGGALFDGEKGLEGHKVDQAFLS